MSRWLQNVGTFLDKLDDQAEQIAQTVEDDDEDEVFLSQKGTVESILAARGLDASGEYLDEDVNEVKDDGDDDKKKTSSAAVARNLSANQLDGNDDGDVDPFDSFDDGIDFADLDTTERTEEPVLREVQVPIAPQSAVSSIMVDDGMAVVEPTKEEDQELDTDSIQKSGVQEQNQQNESSKYEKALPFQSKPAPVTRATSQPTSVQEPSNNSAEDNTSEKPNLAASSNLSIPENNQADPTKEDPSVAAVIAETSVAEIKSSDTPDSTNEIAEAPATSTIEVAEASVSATEHRVEASVLEVNAPPAAPKPVEAAKSVPKKQQQMMTAEAKQALKEVRVLRRHVVSLNKQLENAEAELTAQRDELERAAARMEKDRTRTKDEKTKVLKSHSEEIASLQAQHKKAMEDQQQRSDQQMATVRSQIDDLESRRRQEGGDWHKELDDAVQREKESAQKTHALEEEKATLLAQLSTLQTQQQALGSRLESLTQTTDSAMERERQAEDRLDEALSAHARQVAQRQSREVELERNVAELGAALVEERNRKAAVTSSSSENQGGDRTIDLELEVSALAEQLEHERQRNETLQKELHEITDEHNDENAVNLKRQQRHDEQVNEHARAISKLKLELQESREQLMRSSVLHDGSNNEAESAAQQIRTLSGEVLQHRENNTQAKNEISALKNRLQSAVQRAEQAEIAAEDAAAMAAASSEYSDVELGTPPRSGGDAFKRRVGGRRKGNVKSMSSALFLSSSSDESTQQRVGKALDGLDVFLKESGKFLRYNPVARLFFIFYLVVIHLWTFALVFMHAHSSFDMVHTDSSHGPQTMLQAHSAAISASNSSSNP